MPTGVAVYLEVGTKRTFASAVEWPGWSRGGRSEPEALAALTAYGARYQAVTRKLAPKFRAPTDAADLTIVKRVRGNASTDFGVPALGLPSDGEPMGARELARITGVLEACWDALDRAAKAARGHELSKGPRGGGRDLDKILGHVLEAEEMYLVKLGARPPKGAAGKPLRASELRAAILATLRARARGRPIADPSRTKTLWTPRYFARRAAWHVLDHTWEIEDRASMHRSAAYLETASPA